MANRQDAKHAKEKQVRSEPSAFVDELARKVIGAAIEVHRALGPGYLESVYEEALAVELTLQEIPFVKQHKFHVAYKGRAVGEGRVDFFIAGELITELKTVDSFAPVHRAQVISYLKALKKQLGLLINFHVPVLKDGIERVIHSP